MSIQFLHMHGSGMTPPQLVVQHSLYIGRRHFHHSRLGRRRSGTLRRSKVRRKTHHASNPNLRRLLNSLGDILVFTAFSIKSMQASSTGVSLSSRTTTLFLADRAESVPQSDGLERYGTYTPKVFPILRLLQCRQTARPGNVTCRAVCNRQTSTSRLDNSEKMLKLHQLWYRPRKQGPCQKNVKETDTWYRR